MHEIGRAKSHAILLMISSDEIFYILWSKCQSTTDSYINYFSSRSYFSSPLSETFFLKCRSHPEIFEIQLQSQYLVFRTKKVMRAMRFF